MLGMHCLLAVHCVGLWQPLQERPMSEYIQGALSLDELSTRTQLNHYSL